MKEMDQYEKSKIYDLLVGIPLFSNLSESEIQYLSRQMLVFRLNKGDRIFEEGEAGNCICFVADGVLDVIKKSQLGTSVVIAALPKGSTIGEMAVIDDFPRSATVMARTESILVTFTRDRFDEIMEKHPKLGIKLLKGITRSLSVHLRRTSEMLSDLMLPLYVH